MKKALLLSALVISMPFQSSFAGPGHHHGYAQWGYTGAGAAHRWGDLSSGFEACKNGTAQSPVNIDAFMQGALPPLDVAYNAVSLDVANTGYTVQVNAQNGGGLNFQGKPFTLSHFDFHTPSEHYVDGAPYPMEAQFVHKAPDGSFGIVSVMFKVGAHNPVTEGIWQNVPRAGEVKAVEGVQISVADLLPATRGYFQYQGSLTTPPCSEGVQWFVMKEPITLSAKQLKAFQAVFPVNARPIQDLNGRVVKGD